MEENIVISAAKNTARLTVKGTEQALVVGAVAAKKEVNLITALNNDEKNDIVSIEDMDENARDFVIKKASKSVEKHSSKAKDLKKELKKEKKDLKELNKDIRKNYLLSRKEIKKNAKEFKKNKQAILQRVGPLTEKETSFLKLTEKKDYKKQTTKQRKKERKKAIKRQGAVNALQAKKAYKEDLRSGSGLSSDNLLASGNTGLVGAFTRFLNEKLNPWEIIKRKIAALLMGMLGSLQTFLLPIIVIILILLIPVAAIGGVAKNILNFFGLGGGSDSTSSVAMSAYTAEEIDALVAEREGLTADQETLLRYALSKVGCKYASEEEVINGMSRTGPDTYDCSGLAYDCEKQIGKNITSNDAASQAKLLIKDGKYLTDTSTEPKVGDLIYYSKRTDDHKDKWNYIYHVAIYVGNGYVVEAYGSEVGVIYRPIRTNNVYAICTP